MTKELKSVPDIEEVKKCLKTHLAEVFAMEQLS
jgi:hypothetical protein